MNPQHVHSTALPHARGADFKKHFQENKTPSKKIDQNCNFVEITVEIHFDAYAEGFDFPRVRRNRIISSQEFVTSSSMKTLLSARAWRSVGRFGASSAVSYPSSIYRTLCQPLVR